MRILVTGGAGYIGSFMVKRLLDQNFDVVVADSLDRGNEKNIDTRAHFKKGNLQNKEFAQSLFDGFVFDAVIHFAGFISMGESMTDPAIYFANNTFATLNILEAMRKTGTKHIIFSSTAGVYGNPHKTPIPEEHSTSPTNPYGESKLMVEHLLKWYEKVFGIHSVALRYFNASGGSLDGKMGEQHTPESHIIPLAINAILSNTEFTLYGTDYNTADGTCIRDYIHVLDLVEAHVLALEKLQKDAGSYIYNVGTGIGYSNREVLKSVEKISGKELKIKLDVRRAGDADSLVADATQIKNATGFSPKYSDIDTIVKSAWNWHTKSNPIE